MATKLVKKDKLDFKDGFFYKKNKRVYIESNVVYELNDLETKAQQYAYLEDQGDYHPQPTLDGFERTSINDTVVNIHTSTPILDAEMKKTIDMLEEIDKYNDAEEIERVVKNYIHLIRWLKADEIVVSDTGIDVAVDTPCLGSPLELEYNSILNLITYMVTDGEGYLGDRDD